MSWGFYIISTCIYIVGIYLLLQYKKKDGYKQVPSSGIPSIIAIPRNYVINVIENTSDIDYRKYADVSLNITEILKNNALKSNGDANNHNTSIKISYENIDFYQYVTIKTNKT